MSDEFSALIESVRACRICEQALPLGPRPVLQIDPSAKILIVGQYAQRWHLPKADRNRSRLA